ncbi:MAG: HAMP domain-containing protein [Myxococcales bacterium]|jgi:signal transduction histidine kinase|nr:HAMP domain-containing protein [Myxococcales bacterium]
MKLGIRTKLFVLSLSLIALSLGISYGYLRRTLDANLTLRIEQDLQQRLRLVAYTAERAQLVPSDPKRWQETARALSPLCAARVTLLRSDGRPLADSDVEDDGLAGLPNHLGRPEIAEAQQRGYGRSTRQSATLRRRMMYVAMPFRQADGNIGVARLAMPLLDVDQAMAQLHLVLLVAAVLGLGVAVLMSSAAAHLAARSLQKLTDTAHRMARGDLGTRARSEGEDELAVLGRDLDSLADTLSRALAELSRLASLRREFVANASHELRTPLATLLSAVETLRAGAAHDPAATRTFLDIIYRQADRMHALVNDLLDLSRLESKASKLPLGPLPLLEVVRQVVALSLPRAEDRKQRLTLAPQLPPCRVLADRRSLEQVLTNLLDNAIKYCPAGTEIVVSWTVSPKSPPPGAEVTISVADTGPGIAADHLPRLFERFYRIDTGRSRALGGTGLGLAIVRHAVEAMGGQVSVRSTIGQGTTFTFTLQLVEVGTEAAA